MSLLLLELDEIVGVVSGGQLTQALLISNVDYLKSE